MMLRGGSRRGFSVARDAGVRAHPQLLAAAARDALLARLLALSPGAWAPAEGGGSACCETHSAGVLADGDWLDRLTALEPARADEGREGQARCRIVRLQPAEFMERRLAPQMTALLAVAAPGVIVRVTHGALERGAMTQHRLSGGDALSRTQACRAGWSIALPPLLPVGAPLARDEAQARFLVMLDQD
mgnify:CR=1 FL=1